MNGYSKHVVAKRGVGVEGGLEAGDASNNLATRR